jgi:hypothetical protein
MFHRDCVQVMRAPGPELGEAPSRALRPAAAEPDHPARVVIPHDGQVLVLATAIADLVDADLS